MGSRLFASVEKYLWHIGFGLCFLISSLAAPAQLTEQALSARLKDKVYILRGFYADSKLEFDSGGQPKKKYKTASPFTSGFQIRKVGLTNSELRLTGRRVGFWFARQSDRYEPQGGQLKLAEIDDRLEVTIHLARDGDPTLPLEMTLAKLFASDFDAEMVQTLPSYWRPFFVSGTPAKETAARSEAPSVKKTGVIAPQVISTVDPEYSEAARRANLSGEVTLQTVVNADGSVQVTSIERPLGMGLDEMAIAAVEHYRIKPAMYQGSPVAVQVTMKVIYR